jgi:hypothetical protein
MNTKKHLKHSASQDDDLENLLGSRNVGIRNVAIRVEHGETFANNPLYLSQLRGNYGRLRADSGIARDMNTILIETSIVLSSVMARVVVVARESQLPK